MKNKGCWIIENVEYLKSNDVFLSMLMFFARFKDLEGGTKRGAI